jgi:hypothetical protein
MLSRTEGTGQDDIKDGVPGVKDGVFVVKVRARFLDPIGK